MRELRVSIVLVLVVCLAAATLGGGIARAASFEQWSPFDVGLWGSEVTCLWKSPSGSVFAGTAREGIWVTPDQGAHWLWSGEGIPVAGSAAEPVYRRIVCLQGGRSATDPVFAGCDPGILVSRDNGRTWSATGSELAGIKINTLTLDPATSDRIFAGTVDGVYVSFDEGRSWTVRDDIMKRVSVLQISFDASMPDAVLAACVSGVFKSLDRGETWRSLSAALTGMTVQCLAQDPKRPAILLAGTPGGIYRSYDSGDHWTLLNPLGSRPSTLAMQIDEFDVTSIRAITSQGVVVSSDGGEHWTSEYQTALPVTCGVWNASDTAADTVLGTGRGTLFVTGTKGELRVQDMGFLDVTAVAYDPNVALSYAVRGSSLFSSDGVHPWQVVSPDLGNARVYGFAVDRREPHLMYVATEYGILRSTDGGKGWISLAVTPSDVRGRIQTVAVDPADGANYVYGGNDYGLYRSDRGFRESWVSVGPANVGAVVGVAAYAGDRNLVYVLSAQQLWKTTDRCRTWIVVNDHVASMGLTSLAVADANPALLYAGSQGGAWRSTDGGITWKLLGPEFKGSLINSVVPGPQGQVLAGTSTGFYVSRTVQDNSSPSIQLDAPVDGTKATAPGVVVSGIARDSESGIAAVSINDTVVSVDPVTGRFSSSVTLREGVNHIVVRGEDVAGNVSSVTVQVSYQLQVVMELTVGSSTMHILPEKSTVLDSPPVIVAGRTLVAIRPIVDALGGSVDWSPADRKVTITVRSVVLQLWIDKSSSIVNGALVPIDRSNTTISPKIVSGRTMLPLRFVAEALGAQVDWDAATKKITIIYPAP
ncbi:MAG: stalk domain-containing protein [Candidatus Cryosericum sp.]